MAQISNERRDAERENLANTDRRDFVKGAAAVGLLGAAIIAPVFGQEVEAAQEGAVQNPQAPAGLVRGLLDARYPITYEASVPEGVRVLIQYFGALSRRDLRGMAQSLHFPFASYEGTEPVVVQTVDQLMTHAPASMNMTENPERFSDHDGYLKPGAYDVFDGVEVFNSDPVSVNLALAYNRYGSDGKRILRCEGIYCVTNNDGNWGIQLMSTIFTPSDMVGVTYDDTVQRAIRTRILHDLGVSTEDQDVDNLSSQLGRHAGISRGHIENRGGLPGAGFVQWYNNALAGKAMDSFRIKGVKNRLTIGETTLATLANASQHPQDFAAYRAVFDKLGGWGFAIGILPYTRVIHATVDKAHMYSGMTRYTVAGEEISTSAEINIITYKKGRWGRAGSLAYITNHDRADDMHT